MKKFYLTEAIPYVNAKPHIGHALEFIQADVIARYHRLKGDEAFFLWGTDENALKNVQSAEKEDVPVQEYVNKNAKLFENLAKALNIRLDGFQKTSLENHYKASQKLWELCDKSGDIYKKKYAGLYCVGCEEFKTKTELNENGECVEHPGKKLEHVEEENYFFKLSRYQQPIIDLIESDTYQIVPEFRENEVLSFLKGGLQDFSISRSNQRAKNWGIPVPGDSEQRIYVWFDALIVYLSGIGFGSDEALYNKWWPPELQIVGKGITRFHAIYWIGMLLSAGLPLPKRLFVHEYITVNGQKMSKTIGNVIDPNDLVNKYGAEAVRYYCLAKISPFADSDFSEEKLKVVYNADLANGLGNTVARIARLAENSGFDFEVKELPEDIYPDELKKTFEEFRFNDILQDLWVAHLSIINEHINTHSPWLIKEENKLKVVLQEEITMLRVFAKQIQPFMPDTARKILDQFGTSKIKSEKSLFPRLV